MMQSPFSFMLPDTEWSPTPVSALPSWEGAKRVSIDLETRDDSLKDTGIGVRRDGYVIGIAFSLADGPSHYLPIRHGGGGNLPEEHVWAYLKDQVRHLRGLGTELVGANLQYDLDYLWENGVVFQPQFHRDVQVAEPILDENQFSYSLNNILKRWGLPLKDEDVLKDAAIAHGVNPKSEMWRLHSKFIGSYAEADTALPLRLLELQHQRIEEENLWPIYDMESKVLPILLKMRRRGVRVDLDRVEQISKWCVAEEKKALREIERESGVTIGLDDINKDEYVLDAMEKSGTRLTARTKPSKKHPDGQISTAGDILRAIGTPTAEQILRARKFNKLRGTFVASILRHQVNGRIHCTFNQLKATKDDGSAFGAVGGRLSSSDPNLQQQPARDPETGPRWRSIYIPEDGEIWACNDYSQQEPRWTTHYAEVCGFPKAREMAEAYRTDPKADNHTMMTKLIHGNEVVDDPRFKEHRGNAKTIFLGVCYGMKGASLCKKLGYPTDWTEGKNGNWYEVAGPEGQSIIDSFNKNLPFVGRLTEYVERIAKKRGYIVTGGGRRCRFPKNKSGRGYDFTYRALNRLIQGTSADQMKKAMVDADEAGYELRLQVHDELDLSVASPEVAHGLATVMREALPCNVPARVDVELGPSWGEIK